MAVSRGSGPGTASPARVSSEGGDFSEPPGSAPKSSHDQPSTQGCRDVSGRNAGGHTLSPEVLHKCYF